MRHRCHPCRVLARAGALAAAALVTLPGTAAADAQQSRYDGFSAGAAFSARISDCVLRYVEVSAASRRAETGNAAVLTSVEVRVSEYDTCTQETLRDVSGFDFPGPDALTVNPGLTSARITADVSVADWGTGERTTASVDVTLTAVSAKSTYEWRNRYPTEDAHLTILWQRIPHRNAVAEGVVRFEGADVAVEPSVSAQIVKVTGGSTTVTTPGSGQR